MAPKPISATTVLALTSPPLFRSLDLWRGVAALWVVAVHSCLAYVVNIRQSLLGNPIYKFAVWGRLGVVLFFVISGYCIAGAAFNTLVGERRTRRFVLDRVRRIYPPYLAALAFALCLAYLGAYLKSRLAPDPASPAGSPIAVGDPWLWCANLSLLQRPLGFPSTLLVAWSLSYEVAFYAIVAGWIAVCRRVYPNDAARRAGLLAAGLAATTLASECWLLASPAGCPFPLDLWYQFGIGTLGFFSVASRHSPHFWNASGRSWIPWAVPAAGALCVFIAGPEDLSADGGMFFLGNPSLRIQSIVTVLFLAVLLLQQPSDHVIVRARVAKPFLWVGTFSYSIYLTHTAVIPFVDGAMRRLGFHGSLYLGSLGAQILVAVAAGWLFYRWVERRFIRSGTQIAVTR